MTQNATAVGTKTILTFVIPMVIIAMFAHKVISQAKTATYINSASKVCWCPCTAPSYLDWKWYPAKAIGTPARPHYFLRSESNLFPFGNSTHSLINRSISSVSNAHVTTVTCCLHARRTRPLGHPPRESLGQLFRIAFPLRQQRNWWSHGESNPDLKLAKLAYCRYTDGPKTRCINFTPTIRGTVLLPETFREVIISGEGKPSNFFCCSVHLKSIAITGIPDSGTKPRHFIWAAIRPDWFIYGFYVPTLTWEIGCGRRIWT